MKIIRFFSFCFAWLLPIVASAEGRASQFRGHFLRRPRLCRSRMLWRQADQDSQYRSHGGRRHAPDEFSTPPAVCALHRDPVCLRGAIPRRVNMHVNDRNLCVLFPADKKGLNPEETTIAETLKAKDYATICVGKWHVGDHPNFLPHNQGFDSYFGIPYSNDMNRKEVPLPLLRNERVIESPVDQPMLTPRYTKEVVQLHIQATKTSLSFIYLPHTFPHVPLFASSRFKGKSARGRYGDTIEEIDWSTGRNPKGSQRRGRRRKHLGSVHFRQRIATKGQQRSPARKKRPNLGRRSTSTLRGQMAGQDSRSLRKFRRSFPLSTSFPPLPS